MKVSITKVITVRCVQHPNGEAFVTAEENLPEHYRVLGEKKVPVEFAVDLGESDGRAYPSGRVAVSHLFTVQA